MDVVALGTSSIISGNPDSSYFIQKYSKKTHFSSQLIKLQFPISASFGQEVEIDLYQEGDLINNAYLSFTYPANKPSVVCDSFGTYMLNWVQLEYGDQIIERIDGEFMEMMNDLTVPQTKQGILSNLVGKYLTSNLSVYYVKLDFNIFKKGLPVCALKENPRLRFSLRNFNEGCPSASAVNPPFAATLFVNYVFLPEPERNYFMKNELTYLYEQTQRYDTTSGLSNVTVYTDFQNPTKEFFVVIQNSTGQPYQWPNALVSMRMLLNGVEIITYDLGTSLFMRYLQPLENHTRAPDRNFYMYPFALDPENDSPTGSVNLSGCNQQFNFSVTPPASKYNFHIYTRCYNVLKIQGGLLHVFFPVPFMTSGNTSTLLNYTPPLAVTVTTLAGTVTTLTGTAGSFGSTDGTGSAAWFFQPSGITCDTSGNIYVSDTYNHTIRKIVASTGVVTTLAGTAGSTGSTDGTGSAARFNFPRGITCDTSGNLYVADTSNYTIRKIVASTGVVTTLAGTAGSFGSTDGTGSAARFYQPFGITCDTFDNLYVADTFNHTIRKIVASTGVVTTLAGTAGSTGSTDGTGSAARFYFPRGITWDTSDNLYVADTSNSTIRKIVASTGVVTTLAGTAGSTGSTDGTGSAAWFYQPFSITCDTSGNLYVADTSNYTIRKIVASTGVVTTLAGTAGSTGSTDGTGSVARFYLPRSITWDTSGNLYVADTYNHTIRKIA